MFNVATSRDPEVARALKELYKSVLDTLVSLVENGDGKEPPAAVRNTHGSRTLGWRLSGARGAACGECGCDRFTYEPEGEGVAFEFCPACWSMRGEDRVREATFEVGRELEKRVRDLPPGMSLSLNVGGEELPLGPPRAPGPPCGDREAMESYRTVARTPLEIGRQVWMGRMAFEGTDDVTRDYREARRWFELAARWGHGEALSMLGLMALHGLGGRRDAGKAVELCRQAAERGYARAETGMGRLCWDGEAVPEDRAAAMEWWRRAARQKDAEAQLWLGNALIRGDGVARDAGAGLALVREAAESGDADAQGYLGVVLLEGRAGPPDAREAREWLAKAAGQGNEGAGKRLAGIGG
ncbi:MAG: sel1 repeat family protein [Holophagales bacterium]|nr:sel1 repeat family protein [Holophagales bacterium]